MNRSVTEIAIAVVQCDDRFLVGQRPLGSSLAGYWEFPGGKVEPGETAEQAAIRECREESGLVVEVVGPLDTVEHRYEHDHVRLRFFRCQPTDPRETIRSGFRWVART